MRILSRIVNTAQTARAYVDAAKAAVGGASGLRPTHVNEDPVEVPRDMESGDPTVYLVETYRHNANVAHAGRKWAEEERDDAVHALGKVTVERDRLRKECDRLALKVLDLEESLRFGSIENPAGLGDVVTRVRDELLRNGWKVTERFTTVDRRVGDHIERCDLTTTALYHRPVESDVNHKYPYLGPLPALGDPEIAAIVVRAVTAVDAKIPAQAPTPTPTPPVIQRTLRGYVRGELLRDGWKSTERVGTLVRYQDSDPNNTEWCYLDSTGLHHQTTGYMYAHAYRGVQPYSGHPDISAAIRRAVDAFDAPAETSPQGNKP